MSVPNAADVILRDELESRGYIIFRNTKAAVDTDLPLLTDMLASIGYNVVRRGLTSTALFGQYFAYDQPMADQPALDAWVAAQGESR